MAADIVRLIIAEVGLDAAFEAVGRLGGDEVDQAGRGVAAIERALRPLEHFDAFEVHHRAGVHDRIGISDLVDISPDGRGRREVDRVERSEEHTSELQSLMRISYAVFCLKKNKKGRNDTKVEENMNK